VHYPRRGVHRAKRGAIVEPIVRNRSEADGFAQSVEDKASVVTPLFAAVEQAARNPNSK